MARRRSQRERASGSIGNSGLTPLLDVLFLLLFAILAASDSSNAEASVAEPEEVRVELPAVDPLESGEGDEAEAVRIFLRIDADGTVTIIEAGGVRPTRTASELRTALQDAIVATGAERQMIVEIRADTDARHGVTVDVLQTVRAVGIVDVRFVATAGPDHNDLDRPLGGASGQPQNQPQNPPQGQQRGGGR